MDCFWAHILGGFTWRWMLREVFFDNLFFEYYKNLKIYFSAFNQISIEIPKNVREFSIAVASIADSFGIALAGFTGNNFGIEKIFLKVFTFT